MNNVFSDEQTVSSGVPQGSVFGPLLFLTYINDISTCSRLLDFHLIADDANVSHKNDDLSSLQSNLNDEMKKVYDWI